MQVVLTSLNLVSSWKIIVKLNSLDEIKYYILDLKKVPTIGSDDKNIYVVSCSFNTCWTACFYDSNHCPRLTVGDKDDDNDEDFNHYIAMIVPPCSGQHYCLSPRGSCSFFLLISAKTLNHNYSFFACPWLAKPCSTHKFLPFASFTQEVGKFKIYFFFFLSLTASVYQVTKFWSLKCEKILTEDFCRAFVLFISLPLLINLLI